MDGQFYTDLRFPFIVTAPSSVTLATTDKALTGTQHNPSMGKDYWWLGKAVRIRAFGQITTTTTPGNLTLSVYYGTGADANGTIVAASAAQTLVINQTNISFEIDLTIRCTLIGTAGTLYATGRATFGTAVIAAGTFLIPASGPAASGSVDLTVASNVLMLQAKRSGSTAESMQVVDQQIFALN
jgi:hypothetical protein